MNVSNSVVSNVEIMGLPSSVVASGYSMRTELNEEFSEKAIKRCEALSEAGDGHDQFSTGIVVNFDLTLTNKAWVEAERYRFLNFVSSQSTMHKICNFDIAEQCDSHVDERLIAILNTKVDLYNAWKEFEPEAEWYEDNAWNIKTKEQYNDHVKELYLDVLYNIPAGFKLTARMTTNYRSLRNIYYQRKSHLLPEWREFCKWIESLPYAKELILTRKRKGWIKVTEELPKNHEEVVVYDTEFDTVFVGYYFDGNWRSYEDTNLKIAVSDTDYWIKKPKGSKKNA